MRKFISGFCLVMFLFVFMGNALAGFNFTAGVGLREEYNDNIFLTREDREDDFITNIFPSIKLSYSIRPFDLSLDYGLNFKFYYKHSELNENSSSTAQTLRFQTQLRPARGIYIDVSDVYQRVPIDVRRQVAFENIFINMTDSNVFNVSPYVDLPISSTLSSRFGYSYTNVWYKADEGNDSESHSAFITLQKRWSQFFSTSLKYDYLIQRPQKTDGYKKHQGSVSANLQSGKGLSFWGEIGRAYFDFSDAGSRSLNFWNAGADFARQIKITETTSLGANYSIDFTDTASTSTQRTLRYKIYFDPNSQLLIFYPYYTFDKYSISAGVTKRERADIFLRTGKILKITVNPYYVKDKELETDRKDKVIGVAVDLSRQFSSRLSSSMFGVWEEQTFYPEIEKVKSYRAGVTLNYKLNRRLTPRLGYTYNNSKSNIDEDDFYNNVVWFEVSFTF